MAIDPYELARRLGVNIGPPPLTREQIRAALDEMMDAAACPRCDAVLELIVRRYDDGTMVAYPRVTHVDDCDAA